MKNNTVDHILLRNIIKAQRKGYKVNGSGSVLSRDGSNGDGSAPSRNGSDGVMDVHYHMMAAMVKDVGCRELIII